MEKKPMTVANFNIVFGEAEEPLLNYFDTIVFPAFKMNIMRTKGDTDYLLLDVNVIEASKGNYALTGIIVKKTVLEVFSKFNEENSELIGANELHPTAPFSTFIIYLKNHRMVLVKNQKGSPDLRSFSATIRFVIDRYTRDENVRRKAAKEPLLPISIINIVGIPLRETIEDALKKVYRINKLTLRFYPLNGDIDFSDMFEGITTDLRKKVGSKTGEVVLNSPTSIGGVTEVITVAQGTIEPIFKVTYQGGKKGKIQNGQLSENMEIAVLNDKIESNIFYISQEAQSVESIQFVSKDNEVIYSNHKSNIIKFIKK